MKVRGWIAVIAGSFAVGGCGGLKVSMDYDPEADFSGWRTYAWAERTDEGELDPRVYNSIVEGRVKVAVDKTLRNKGYSEAVTGEPDFLVAWHGAIDGKVSVNTVTTHYGYGWGWYGGFGATQTYVNEWDEGTLVIDLIDARENKLVWRGSGTDTVSGTQRSPEEGQRAFDDAVAKILNNFPPGGGG